jgi:hypothetical protein
VLVVLVRSLNTYVRRFCFFLPPLADIYYSGFWGDRGRPGAPDIAKGQGAQREKPPPFGFAERSIKNDGLKNSLSLSLSLSLSEVALVNEILDLRANRV